MPDNTIAGAAAAYQEANRAISGVGGSGNDDGTNFSDLVANAISDSVDTIRQAEAAGQASLNGEVSLEELATAVANAELTLKTVIAVRDRIINAYQEIIKMPI